MVQFINQPVSRKELMKEQIGYSMGQGLSNFANYFYANKALNSVLDDKELRSKPLSDRMEALEKATRPFGEVGQNLLQRRQGIETQRQLEGMFAKGKEIAANPKSTNADILFGLMEAGAGIPGSEKYIGQAFQVLAQQRQAQAATGATEQQPLQQTQRQPLPQSFAQNLQDRSGQQIPQQTNGIAPASVNEQQIGSEKLGQTQVPATPNLGFSDSFIPPGLADQLISAELRNGGDGQFTTTRINSINNQIREGRRLQQEDRDWMIQNQDLERAREQKFREYADPLLKQEFSTLSAVDKAKTDQYAKDIDRQDVEEGIVNTPAELYLKTRRRLNDYLTYKGRLEGTPVEKETNELVTKNGVPTQEKVKEVTYKGGVQERPNIFSTTSTKGKELMSVIQDEVKPLVQMGEGDEARKILASKGYYFDEIEEAINPLFDEQKKSMKEIGRASESKQSVGALLSPENYKKITNKNIENLVKGLQKSLNQNTSLVLLMKEAEHLGYDTYEFNEALNTMKKNGYKLSAEQIRDLPQLNKPTITFLRKIFG